MGRLREGTHDLHESIEARLDLPGRLDSVDSYRHLLERFYGFYLPLEEWLSAPARAGDWEDIGIDFTLRRKSALLEADLEALGCPVYAQAGLPFCPAERMPRPASAAELAGCAYVLEGATLGGQVIGRHLHAALGLPPGGLGARFFYGYGEGNGAMWHQFCRAVESFAARAESPVADLAVSAARRTFADMENWLLPDSKPDAL